MSNRVKPKFIDPAMATDSEVTSAVSAAESQIQTQLNGKQAGPLTGDVTTSGAAATIANSAVTNAKMANMATQTIKGRTTAGSGAPEDLTATQATAVLNAFGGDSGSGGTKGLVPAPASGDAAANKVLGAGGTWVTAAGGTSSPLTTKGDLYTYDTGNARLGVGANGYKLVADSAQSLGIKWASEGRTINAQTGTSYTFVLADGNAAGGNPLVTASNAAAQSYTVPPNSSVAFPVGTQIDLSQLGAGLVTLVAGSGVTLNSLSGSLALGGQYAAVSLVKTATDTWQVYGSGTSSSSGPRSSVRLNTANGYGSTNTRIVRFTNTITNTGSDITYADSSTLGASFTINSAGVYSISYTQSFNSGGWSGISLNSSQLTTDIYSISPTDRLTLISGSQTTSSVTVILAVNDVIRAHADATATNTDAGRSHFTITKVSN